MKLSKTARWSFLSVVLLVVCAATVWSDDPSIPDQRAASQDAMKKGNFKDAYTGFRKLCMEPKNDPRLVGGDLDAATQCLARLGRVNEIDELLESTIGVHKGNWRLLQSAANQYLAQQHQGFMIAGTYERGYHRGGGKAVNSLERDRVRAMQLMQQALPLVKADDQKDEVAQFYISLASQLLYNRGYSDAWRLQYLANLAELPDYEDGYPYYRNYTGAPVDEENKPIFHAVGKSWEDSKTDGERWRWALEQAIENSPARKNDVLMQLAQFSQNQYDVQTMNQFGGGRRFFGLPTTDDGQKNESGTYAMHTLSEKETIAKLATGIKRFALPDDYNFIKLYQQIAAEPKTGHGEAAVNSLAQLFLNRRQFPQAAKYWKQSIEQYGPGNNNYKQLSLEQIVGNWGSFENVSTFPAGEGATVEFRYRNGKKIKLQAQTINVTKLLDDVKAYLKSDPGQLNGQKIDVNNIGWRIVQNDEAQYVGEAVANWELDLEPRESHFDKRVTVSTPLQKPGAYLVTAAMVDGNVSKTVLWVSDTAIVHKTLAGKNLYYVADSVTGKPVEGANLEFFGYQQKHLGNNKWQILTTNFAEKTDKDGQSMPDPRDLKVEPSMPWHWLVTVRDDKGGRFAHLGFWNVWNGEYHDADYNALKYFCITDRPVYRPEQKVQFKIWMREAKYDLDDSAAVGKQSLNVDLHNPKGEKILSQNLTTDDYGGVEFSYDLPKDAQLGMYSLRFPNLPPNRIYNIGGNSFRVEEYKKPEFEVSVEAPTEPVMLGEKITAKIKAKYYFGSPVTNAKVKFKIMRNDYQDNWYPIAPWDWCFGPGYWWFSYDTPWYPGWREWCGCKRPAPWWIYRGNPNPPELVAEQELDIKPDGTVDVNIDTDVAKALHGHKDHEYSITAEVRDESRRTIVGQGKVLVARKPFKVFSWVDRGYFRVGDTVNAHFTAHTLDKKPVEGKGVLTLLKITYDKDQKPVETPVRRWEVNTNAEGKANQQLRASAKGQYRISYELTDAKEHKIEGGYLFTIIGDGFDVPTTASTAWSSSPTSGNISRVKR